MTVLTHKYKNFIFKIIEGYYADTLLIQSINHDNKYSILFPQHELPIMMKREPVQYYDNFFDKFRNDNEMKDFAINLFYESWPKIKEEKQC